ncbi:MAG TPA: uroporphyrinogen-III synthase [Acidobacteriaceae bacterium]|nr:uroporphyrinogen-III synthase [Acidobacteriaceae bacterium]
MHMAETGFGGLRVLALESRRAKEIATLIRNNGGVPTVVPVMREVPLESNEEAFAFARRLMAAEFDAVLFLTGAGTRILFQAIETRIPREDFLAAMRRTRIVARGPKPVAVLREWGLSASIVSPEPSTWREVLDALDNAAGVELRGMRIAVQEYGVPNQPLLDGLHDRGAVITRVPVYQWALPEDQSEMRGTIEALGRGAFDVVLFLTGTQAAHLCQVAEQMGRKTAVLQNLRRMVVVSVGPSTTEELSRQGITPDFQPSHPKMGILVNESAQAAAHLLALKRNTPPRASEAP